MGIYSYQNGLLVSNQDSHNAAFVAPLANISTFNELSAANIAAIQAGSEHSINSIQTLGALKGAEYDSNFELSPALVEAFGNEGAIDELMAIFEKNAIPLGLLSKLQALASYDVNFIIDDSGSTNAESDALLSAAHPCMIEGKQVGLTQKMTRFQEIESRIHFLIDFLAYFPAINLSFSFLNNGHNASASEGAGNNFSVSNKERLTPKQYAEGLHQEIRTKFSFRPKFQTPIHSALKASFELSEELNRATHHYLLTDGLPSDASVDEIITVIKTRRSPEENLVTLCSCSNEDKDVAWLKLVEEAAYYCSESDDYHDERREVQKDQGPAFPFTQGFWLMMLIAASKNPNDLDSIDENLPLTKNTFETLLGRTLSQEEYRYYFDLNPHAKLYRDRFEHFAAEGQVLPAIKIIPLTVRQQREEIAGYNEGALPGNETDAALYSYLPLSRYTFTELYHPEIAHPVAQAPIVESSGCCSFFSTPPPLPPVPSPYVAMAQYKAYFDSLPAVKAMSEPYRESLFQRLSSETKAHAHKMIDFSKLQAQVDKRFDDATTAVSHDQTLEIEHIQPQVDGVSGFSLLA